MKRVNQMAMRAVGMDMPLIVTGCGGGNSGSAQDSTPATSSAVSSEQVPTAATQAPASDLGEPRPSGVEGLPVPSSAVKAEGSSPESELWTVPAATGDELVAWYRQHMPVGQDWRGWPWCEFQELNESIQWYWVRGAERDLTVVLTPHDNPPGIVLATGEAYEPC